MCVYRGGHGVPYHAIAQLTRNPLLIRAVADMRSQMERIMYARSMRGITENYQYVSIAVMWKRFRIGMPRLPQTDV